MKRSLKNLKLTQNSNIPYWSDGDFSMHELLECLLEQTGPATVQISSFSITEVAVRSFSRLQENGLMKNLRCLLDLTVKRHRLGLLFFASNVVSGISLSKCHAKLILIENNDWNVTVVGSANFQVNDKKELGIISTKPAMFQKFIMIYNEWFESGYKVDLNEFE